MRATVHVESLETYRFKNNRYIDEKKPQQLDEEQLCDNGRLKDTVDVSLKNSEFSIWENCFSGFEQLLGYLRHSSQEKTPFRQRFDVDIVTNVMTLDQFAKFQYYPNEAGGEFYAVRMFDTVFLNVRERPEKRRLDEWVNDAVKNLKYLLTLGDNGKPRNDFERNIDANRTFAVIKTTLTAGDKKIVVGYQALIDAVDKDQNFVKFRVKPRARKIKAPNVKYLGNYLVARLSNIHFTVTGNWVVRYLNQPKMKTDQDWLIATYDKDLTSEMPAKCQRRADYVGWTEESVMGGLFELLERVKTLLDENGKSIQMTLAKDGTVTIDEKPKPYDLIMESVSQHFTA